VVSELEDLSKRLQRDLHAEGYRSPVLAGVGQGGTLAYAALAQSPAATIGGAVAVSPAPALATRVALCEGAPASAASGGGFRYGPPREPLHGLLLVAADARTPDLEGWRAVVEADPSARLVDLEGPDAGAQLLAALRAALRDLESAREQPAVPGLPLVEIPADEPGPLLAIIYSGDGGWRDLDKTIGEMLAAHGTPVVGVDSLRYFWHEKTPEEMAADLAEIIDHYRALWSTPQVLLIGYSFGADVLPFAVNRLPAAERAAVVQVTLLGVEPHAPFEISVADWLGEQPEDAPAVLPELLKIPAREVQCVYGEEEEDTLCRAPELAGVELIRTSGGHHFGEDYSALAQRILDGAARREGGGAKPGAGGSPPGG
jgi:type IV secretory pathway VirJ component